jgi:hypothetical protein
MRAREFIVERKDLSPEQAAPMQHTYVVPGLSAADPYNNYRFGVAIARARSDYSHDGVNPHMPEWSAETAFGEHGVVSGMNAGIGDLIDAALTMTKTPGGKQLVSTPDSTEPDFVPKQSPVKAFKGYPR